ncbi:protein EXECUTER 1, chloroplastic [Quillaja saponaria]|uniref:Protein EXECUTER 1, chloroplastic n=1 Tax=Quillaja saponaria TaxID=32244 RepID=A0AAD7LDQ9_QUISA|nr:protein EXECUTER 1, chloroplastic [Quillaja saponaria]
MFSHTYPSVAGQLPKEIELRNPTTPEAEIQTVTFCGRKTREMVVVTNACGVGQAVPITQLRPFCCLDFPAEKSSSLSYFLGWGCTVQSRLSISSQKNRKNSTLSCRCTTTSSSNNNSNNNCNGSSLDWDWNRWSRHFSEIEQADSFASVLKFQLEEAIEKEDFQEAAKLKMVIAEATSKDSVAEIMYQLKNAIDEERYHDASRLCRYTGSGLVGWWVGYSKDSDDPFGRLIRVSPSMGRFVGRSYSARQLLTASPGTPMFEIYVVKNADETYHMQVVYLRRSKGNTLNTSTPVPVNSPSKSEVEKASPAEVQEHEDKMEINEEKSTNIEGATEEGIKSVINFLKEKIPGLKVKVMNVNVTEEETEDNDSVKQLMQDDDNDTTSSSENSEDDVGNLDEIQPEGVTLQGESDASEEEKDLDMKLYIGGVVHNTEDASAKDEFVRLPAEIKDMDRDSFVFHIPKGNLDHDAGESKVSNIKVAALAAKGVSELMPSEFAKAFWSPDMVSSKVSKKVRAMVKLAISQAQKRSTLSEYTTFNRITTTRGGLDPFDGLYVGAFGPYGTEVVQLRRRFGHWNGVDDSVSSPDTEFFEYVEAVKLTGDLNVPAGQVTFRAKIGRGIRNTNRGMYPDELGVVASYKGQGRIAEFGFKNPQWVDGELLQLNGKGIGPYVKGADLGFLYVVPEQSFLVLFNRLKLPE